MPSDETTDSLRNRVIRVQDLLKGGLSIDPSRSSRIVSGSLMPAQSVEFCELLVVCSHSPILQHTVDMLEALDKALLKYSQKSMAAKSVGLPCIPPRPVYLLALSGSFARRNTKTSSLPCELVRMSAGGPC